MRTLRGIRGAACVAAFIVPAACLAGRGSARGREVMSLDGTWQIVFDEKNEGRERQWVRGDRFPCNRAREAVVPGCWELIEKDYEGVAFYRRSFTVPETWAGKVVRLQFDAVNFRAEVWLNAHAVGCHDGGFTPFEFRVDDLLEPGAENTLILRVVGPILLQEKRIDGLGPLETPQWRGAIAGGIWQPVRLVATGKLYVTDVFIEPRLSDDSATFHLEIENGGARAARAEVEITVDPAAARRRRSVLLRPGPNALAMRLGIPGAVYWSPDNPYLYRAEVRLVRGGVASDRWTWRFGMREFTIRDRRFCLNGKPFYLKATFFEGLYPVKLAYPDNRAMAAREIRLAKEAGFTMIRPWRKPPPPMWLDLADELGVLTVGSPAVECMDLPVESARLPGWVENEVRESIRRDRNRTCVVLWELFNELKRPVLKRLLRPMTILARRCDPTRLILDESGGWAQGANIYLPYEFEPVKFNDIHDYPGPQINEEVYNKLLWAGRLTHAEMRARGWKGRLPGRNVVPGLMTFFSELGYGSLPDLEDSNRRFAAAGNPLAPPAVYHRRLAEQTRRDLAESGFDRIFPDLRAFCLEEQRLHGAANRRMIEAVRCNPAVQGYCIHALTAGDWIIGAGLLDLFRNPKTYAYEATKAANRPRILSIRVRPRNVYAERGTRIEITAVNERAAAAGRLTVAVVGRDGAAAYTETVAVDLASGISRLFSTELDTRTLAGTYTVRASVTGAGNAVLTAAEYAFDVFAGKPRMAGTARVAVLDPSGVLKPFLRRAGIPFVEFTAAVDRTCPVFVSRTAAGTAALRKRFEEVAAFVRAGGTAVYLQGGGARAPWGRGGPASRLLPVAARLKQARGLWTCIPHVVKDHPVFTGLPVNCPMGPLYENVWAETTLIGAGGEPIVASFGYDWFPDYDLRRRHYTGPGDTWWGADLAVVPVGAGRCVLSQLRVVENLGRDPVADRILVNLIAWTTGS